MYLFSIKTTGESASYETHPPADDTKTGTSNVNGLAESALPISSRKGLLSSFPSDFSSILEDVNTLKKFLKVVAPVFVNGIRAQKKNGTGQAEMNGPLDLAGHDRCRTEYLKTTTDSPVVASSERSENATPVSHFGEKQTTITDKANDWREIHIDSHGLGFHKENSLLKDTGGVKCNNFTYELLDSLSLEGTLPEPENKENSLRPSQLPNHIAPIRQELVNASSLYHQPEVQTLPIPYPSFEQQYGDDFDLSQGSNHTPIHSPRAKCFKKTTCTKTNLATGQTMEEMTPSSDMWKKLQADSPARIVQGYKGNRGLTESSVCPGNPDLSKNDSDRPPAFCSDDKNLQKNERLKTILKESIPSYSTMCRSSVSGLIQGAGQSVSIDWQL